VDATARLLTAASELMYRRGYEAVGVAELCDRADVRKGSFYHWFPSKAALAVAMLDRDWQRTRLQLFEPAFGEVASPLERFDRYAAELLAHNRRVHEREGAVLGCRFGNFAAELSSRDPLVQAKLAEVFASMRSYFAATIEAAVREGDIPPVDAGRAAVAVLAHVEGLQLVAKAAADPDVLGRFGEDVRALLGAPPRPTPPADHEEPSA
jgi:TetR/AcrR family transcriptional repressor of nem operon